MAAYGSVIVTILIGILVSPHPAAVVAQSVQPRTSGNDKAVSSELAGRVMTPEGQPLRRAQVRATSPALNEPRIVSTDTDGRWTMSNLPTGRYLVTVSKQGYITVEFGQRRPFERGKPIELAEGKRLERLDIYVPKGAAITGRILDEFGDPFAGVRVSALRYRYIGGQRRLVAIGVSDTTDDIGQYRLYRLIPGEYYVYAVGSTKLDFLSDKNSYSGIYFPGTTRVSEAQRVMVSQGGESPNVTFPLPLVRVATLSGIVTDSHGNPMSNCVVQLSAASPLNPGGVRTLPHAMVGSDGRFTIANVPPGEYRIETLSFADLAAVAASGTTSAMSYAETASMDLVVTGDNIRDLVLVSRPGGTATGRIRFEGGPRPDVTPKRVTLLAEPADPGVPLTKSGAIRVHDDWTFEARAMLGRRLFRIAAPSEWVLKAVTWEGTDVTDSGINFQPGQTVTGIEIILSRSTRSVTGTVITTTGKIAADYVVVAFADDPRKWGIGTRFVRTARPDQTGEFVLDDLSPADYLLVALEYLEAGEESDPDLLDRLSRDAMRVTIEAGAPKSVTLRLQ